MASQLGKNVTIAYKVESTFNTPVSGASATQMRAAPGDGLKLTRSNNMPSEFRGDGQKPMGRLGFKSVAGNYLGDLAVGQWNPFVQGLFRAAFDSAQTISTATITSVAIGTNAIVNQGTASFLASGLKVGDMFRLAGNVGANASKNLGPITALTTNTLLVPAAQLVTIATMATLTFTRPAKVVNPTTVASMTRYSWTVEEYHSDLDDSELYSGVRVVGAKFSFPPDGPVTVEWRFLGANMSVPGTAAAPNFTSPTLTTYLPLQASDASIRFASGTITTLTSAEIEIDLGAQGVPVIGASVTPDIFESAFDVKVRLTGLRTDMTNVSAFLAETEADLHILCVENETEPKDFVAFYVPRLKRTSADAPVGQEGGMTETMELYAAVLDVTSGYDTATMAVQSSI